MRRAPLLLLLLAAGRAAADPAAGTSGGASLELGGSARAIGMGGAGAASLAEPGSIWVNPAGLAALEGLGGGAFLHGASFADIAVDQLAIAAPVPAGMMGAAYASTRLGTIASFDRNGTEAGLPLTPDDWSAALAWAGRRGDLRAGAAAWYVHSELAADAVATAWAADLGAVWSPSPALAFGAAVQHLGSGLKFGTATASLPMTARGGVTWRAGNAGLTLAVDGVKPADEAFGVRAGAEERVAVAKGWWLSARGGWRSVAAGTGSGLAAGGGVEWVPGASSGERDEGIAREGGSRFGISAVRVDYAWTPLGELGAAQWFALALAF